MNSIIRCVLEIRPSLTIAMFTPFFVCHAVLTLARSEDLATEASVTSVSEAIDSIADTVKAKPSSRNVPPVTGKPKQMSGDMDMSAMDMSSMQGGSAPADARDPDYSEGLPMSEMHGGGMAMADGEPFGKFLFDQLEFVDGIGGTDAIGAAIDAQAFFGTDSDKLWLKADGEHTDGVLRDLRTEALWAHALTAFWDTQVGIRQDFGEGPNRTWAAFGVQGLAPYWFDIEAMVYIDPSSGRTAARFEAEYDLMLTQRLILTPDLELNAYGRNDPSRRLGAGLSNVELGLRLRYEIRRQFAPYIGINLSRRIGNTDDLARSAGEPALDSEFVAGIRAWF